MADRIIIFAFIFLGLLARVPYSLAIEERGNRQQAAQGADLSLAKESSPTVDLDRANAVKGGVAFVGRDPFWPVGYEPPPPERGTGLQGGGAQAAAAGDGREDQSALDLAGLSPEEQRVIRERLRLGGVLQQAGEIWAILNNQLVKQGETVTIDSGRKHYLFLVKKLTPDRIVLESKQDP